MNISVHFVKQPWIRRVHPDNAEQRYVRGYKPLPGSTLTDAFVQLTASDFLNELSPAAHPINSRYMSTRPIWKPTGKKDENGKDEWAIDGYDDLESVALGWQQFVVGNKIAHLTGDGVFDLANETTDSASYENLLSYIDSSSIKDAMVEAVYYCERAGDSGLYLYQTPDGEIDWQVYATEKGHTIYPQEDENGQPVYYIQYQKDGKEMVDIISTQSFETWVKADVTKESDMPFFEKLRRVLNRPATDKSEDGFVKVKHVDSQAGSDLIQFVYFRVPDTSWGPAEQSIENHENAASYVANEVKDSAYPLLVLKSEKVTTLPPSSMNGKTIAIKGTADSLAHSDVHFESPADASNIATVHFKELNDDIIRTTMTAVITPDIMKQGADSSTSIKILFRPEIEWAKQRWIHYIKPVRLLVKILKRLVGKIEGDLDTYDKLRTSVWQNVWIPQNEKELTDIVTSKVYARVISRKAAMNELGSQYKGDYEQVQKEWEEELAMKQKYGSSKDDDNPNTPAISVTNEASGKSISDGLN